MNDKKVSPRSLTGRARGVRTRGERVRIPSGASVLQFKKKEVSKKNEF